jgi:crotonobetainyl-CoA:carnitine CoA-transferase CaiB-like acyl-CoA transferase
MKELVQEADVVMNNLLFGSLGKLGFGFEDVLEMIKGRKRGIVYVETVGWGKVIRSIRIHMNSSYP